MMTTQTIRELREALRPARRAGQSIGFVPTMGALHDGHWSLIERARADCDTVVVSIFVNPLQFGAGEDLDRYPNTLEADHSGCRQRGVDVVFDPDVGEMYGAYPLTRVHVAKLGDGLCGTTRGGHFDGVCTVVAKLFNIVQPDRAFFGEKDYQQLVIVRKMAADLSMGVEVVACPTRREADGSAMSSRNQYLSERQRKAAACIYASLQMAAESVASGELESKNLIRAIHTHVTSHGADRIDYVEIVDTESLESVSRIEKSARICIAAYFGDTRLIDNVAVDAPLAPR